MITDKVYKKLLDDLNHNKLNGPFISRALSDSVEIAKIWDSPVIEGESSEIIKVYLVKEHNCYIGVVYELENDLYAYMMPKYRKQDKMSSALINIILPHLLQQKPILRTVLNTTLLGSERNYNIAKRLANKVGFKALIENANGCRMTMDAATLQDRMYIRGTYEKLKQESLKIIITKVNYTIDLLEVIQTELEYKCGFTATSEALNDQIRELKNFIPRLESAKFVEKG